MLRNSSVCACAVQNWLRTAQNDWHDAERLKLQCLASLISHVNDVTLKLVSVLNAHDTWTSMSTAWSLDASGTLCTQLPRQWRSVSQACDSHRRRQSSLTMLMSVVHCFRVIL